MQLPNGGVALAEPVAPSSTPPASTHIQSVAAIPITTHSSAGRHHILAGRTVPTNTATTSSTPAATNTSAAGPAGATGSGRDKITAGGSASAGHHLAPTAAHGQSQSTGTSSSATYSRSGPAANTKIGGEPAAGATEAPGSAAITSPGSRTGAHAGFAPASANGTGTDDGFSSSTRFGQGATVTASTARIAAATTAGAKVAPGAGTSTISSTTAPHSRQHSGFLPSLSLPRQHHTLSHHHESDDGTPDDDDDRRARDHALFHHYQAAQTYLSTSPSSPDARLRPLPSSLSKSLPSPPPPEQETSIPSKQPQYRPRKDSLTNQSHHLALRRTQLGPTPRPRQNSQPLLGDYLNKSSPGPASHITHPSLLADLPPPHQPTPRHAPNPVGFRSASAAGIRSDSSWVAADHQPLRPATPSRARPPSAASASANNVDRAAALLGNGYAASNGPVNTYTHYSHSPSTPNSGPQERRPSQPSAVLLSAFPAIVQSGRSSERPDNTQGIDPALQPAGRVASSTLAQNQVTAGSRSPGRPQSRAAPSPGLHNLNRWSSSTIDSQIPPEHDEQPAKAPPTPSRHAPPLEENPSPRTTSRRQSIDSVNLFGRHTAASSLSNLSPRRLVRRASTFAGDFSPRDRGKSRSRKSSATPSTVQTALPNLPPIVALSPIEAASPTFQSDSLASLAQPATSSDQSGEAGSGSLRHRLWDAIDSADVPATTTLTDTRALPQGLLPSPTVVPAGPNNTKPSSNMPGHTRNRSSATKGSGDSRDSSKGKSKPSQKAMLSKALSKANTAVQYDNATNYEAARASYMEACDLLQHVLARTNGEEDRKKLEAIRGTYTSRIDELDGMVPLQPSNKQLPARPGSIEYNGVEVYPEEYDTLQEPAIIETATVTRVNGDSTQTPTSPGLPKLLALDMSRLGSPSSIPKDPTRSPLQSSFSPLRRNFEGPTLNLPRSDNTTAMPAPLSPLRTAKSPVPGDDDDIPRQDFSLGGSHLAPESRGMGHVRNFSHESASWLDPINEALDSPRSSIHSCSSSGYRRRHVRNTSGNTEAEFDAALDAAVEAAYDEGFEPADPPENPYTMDDDDEGNSVVASAMRKVELARERVRQTERENAIELARDKERQRQLSLGSDFRKYGSEFYDLDDSDEEEERMLDEITRESVFGEFSFDQQPRSQTSSFPRESDSSGITSRTWHSSMGSNPATTSTSLSTVTEIPPAPISKNAPPSLPPPQALPQIPSRPGSAAAGVRTRRLSGQNAKQLKIETSPVGQPPSVPAPDPTAPARAGGYIAQQRQNLAANRHLGNRAPPSPTRTDSPSDALSPPPPTPPEKSPINDTEEQRNGSPTATRPPLRTTFSSSSIKSMRPRQYSTAYTDDSTDLSPLTQQMSHPGLSRHAMPAMPPTPLASVFDSKAGRANGLFLFDADIHEAPATSPHSPKILDPDLPVPLEPCPSDVMLRPFWLMRALYQTLAHPRGGYITQKLFVPRDAWKVKGVKLRGLEEKMAQCDLLTAALLNLGRVDSNDADAVLEEMQNLENVLETVQATLQRKLGSEVGTQGVSSLRDEGANNDANSAVPRAASVSGKGAFSWRRLRGKGSAVNLSSAYGNKTTSGSSNGNAPNDRESVNASIPTLPMVTNPSSRPAKRDMGSVKFDGPFAGYMASLARLFDAAQTVDQIARQVDDPGLRHADKTQVGLELCTRHAAEFFGFYICRFVMADLTLLLDKHVKRGAEWVLT